MGLNRAFGRFNLLMAAMAAASAGLTGHNAMVARNEAFSSAGGYSSHGKRKTKTHDGGGTAAFRRGAKKRRNQLRHRAACKGGA